MLLFRFDVISVITALTVGGFGATISATELIDLADLVELTIHAQLLSNFANLDTGPLDNRAQMSAHRLIGDGVILGVTAVGAGCRERELNGNDGR